MNKKKNEGAIAEDSTAAEYGRNWGVVMKRLNLAYNREWLKEEFGQLNEQAKEVGMRVLFAGLSLNCKFIQWCGHILKSEGGSGL